MCENRMSDNNLTINIATPKSRETVQLPEGATMEDVRKIVEDTLDNQIGSLKFLKNSQKVENFLEKIASGDTVVVAPEKFENAVRSIFVICHCE